MRKFIRLFSLALVVVAIACGESNPPSTDKIDSSTVDNAPVVIDTVNAPRLVAAANDGSISLNAETGKAEGPAIKYMPEWRAFGWFTSADSVTWDVDVKDGGDYEVQLEWSVDDGEAGKEFLLRTNADELIGKVDKSGSWETYKTKNIGTITLKSGSEKVVFKSKNTFSKDSALMDLRNLKLMKKM